MIPVVMGKADYSFWMPRSGYINALDYRSPQDVAEFLNGLACDEAAYNGYFEWKRYLRFEDGPPMQSYLCEMCIKLNMEEVAGVVEKKMVGNVSELFGPQQNCYEYSTNHSGIVKGENLNVFDYMSLDNEFDNEMIRA